MNYTTVYVGMDVHKESFTLCCYTNEKEKTEYPQKVNGHYSKVLNYINAMRKHYGDDAVFVCGYEAGCLGFTLYHQLTEHNVDCVILAPTTMPQPQGHKLALKKVKQQIIAFCLRHDYRYTEGKSNWTEKHLQWLRSLESNGVYAEILEEYLLTYEYLTSKLEMLESRIKELAELDEYKESVQKLRCFIGIDTITALSLVVEVGDFHRFATAGHFMSYIGLTPGEDSSGQDQNRLGITKAGNRHLRKLLSESSQCFSRGKVGAKSVALKKRQQGNPPAVIEYADKANIRLKKRFYHLVLNKGKHRNVAIIAVSRELAGFIWGMMTEQFV